MGPTGSTVAQRARLSFEMSILYHSRHRNRKSEDELDRRYVPFERLLADSDFVSIYLPLTVETPYLFNRPAFALMKKTALLVNVDHGPIVDESVLVSALLDREIAGAVLDVYEKELEPHPELMRMQERIILSFPYRKCHCQHS